MKILQQRRGITMVEVIVAFAVLLLCISMATVSLQMAAGAQKRAVDRREEIYQLETAVYGNSGHSGGTDQWTWKADSLHFRGFSLKLYVKTVTDSSGELGVTIVEDIS